jgi:glycosyltransferase involved in cell wall biosynthesis
MRNFAADYYRLSPESISLIPNPIDTELFAPAGTEPTRPSILFVGRFSREKGAEVLIDSIPPLLAALPDLSFTLAGESGPGEDGRPLVEVLLEKARTCKAADRIRWNNNLPYDQLPRLYRESTLAVLPSEYESFSLVCAEAQASGIPVVASNAGGIPEVVEDGKTGLLVPPGDGDAITRAITSLLKNPEKRARMGQRGRERAVRRWSYDAVAPLLESFMARLKRGG